MKTTNETGKPNLEITIQKSDLSAILTLWLENCVPSAVGVSPGCVLARLERTKVTAVVLSGKA